MMNGVLCSLQVDVLCFGDCREGVVAVQGAAGVTGAYPELSAICDVNINTGSCFCLSSLLIAEPTSLCRWLASGVLPKIGSTNAYKASPLLCRLRFTALVLFLRGGMRSHKAGGVLASYAPSRLQKEIRVLHVVASDSCTDRRRCKAEREGGDNHR